MSSVSPTLSEIFNAMQHDISDDHNVLSVRYKYGMMTTHRIRDIVKEIINGKHNGERFLCTNVRHQQQQQQQHYSKHVVNGLLNLSVL